MEKYKVNRRSPIYGTKEISVEPNGAKIYSEELSIEVKDTDIYGLFPNSTLTLIRKANRGEYSKIINGDLIIKRIDGNVVYTNLISNDRIYINGAPSILYDNNGNLLGAKYEFTEDHNIFLQDLLNNDYNIILSAYTSDGKFIASFSQFEIIKGTGFDFASSSDTYTTNSTEDCNGIKTERIYTYLPLDFSTNALFIHTNNLPQEEISYFEKNCNSFYWVDNSNICHLWIDTIEPNNQIISLNKNYAFWNISISFSQDNEYELLGLDEFEKMNMVDDKIEEVIPLPIDMERVKFSPISNYDSTGTVNSIIFNMHFRKREFKDEKYDNEGNLLFKDGWYIDDNKDEGWNESGETSDLMGYLGFTDNDIFYRKSKVKKSFLRLSFYDNNDPLTQSLLYYSTIFLDSGELYGKYIKQKDAIENNEIQWKYAVDLCPDNSISARVDTKITITNEYDRTKSSEGFNIYLFADDLQANTNSTIYMKVEFNHAGNGKTIPLIQVKNEDELIDGISVEDYLSRLYIKVNLAYINNTYCYYFNEDDVIKKNNNIIFVLYEPKLKKSNGKNL